MVSSLVYKKAAFSVAQIDVCVTKPTKNHSPNTIKPTWTNPLTVHADDNAGSHETSPPQTVKLVLLSASPYYFRTLWPHQSNLHLSIRIFTPSTRDYPHLYFKFHI